MPCWSLSNDSLWLTLPSSFIEKHDTTLTFWSILISYLSSVASLICPLPSYSLGPEQETEKKMMIGKHFSEIAKLSVRYQHCSD